MTVLLKCDLLFGTDYLETRCGLVDAVVVDTVMTIQLRDNTHPIEARPECRSFIEFKAKKNYSLQATIRNLHLTESSPQKLCLTHFLMVRKSYQVNRTNLY